MVGNSLELLPQKLSHFSSKTYWDDFFVKWKRSTTSEESFEWYGTWSDVRLIVKARCQSCKVLNIGCGNSSLAEDMLHDGFTEIVSVDFSEIAINEMKKKTAGQPGLSFEVMDILDLKEAWTDTFDVVMDKGTLDAMIHDDDKDAISSKLFSQLSKVLKDGGLYICISLSQQHILEALLAAFTPLLGFSVSIYHFEPENGSALQPFIFIIQKAADIPGVFLKFESEVEAVTLDQASQAMNDRRMVYQMQQNVKTSGKGLRGKFALWDSRQASDNPRFLLSVVDSGLVTQDIQCGVFLVPQGREIEWTFATEEGQMQVASSNKIGRLIIVALGRNHEFESMKAVQDELSSILMPLTLAGSDQRVPYMTIGGDLGSRRTVAKFESELSGPITVEDIRISPKETHRRMVFLRSGDIIQSEARLVAKKTNKKKKIMSVDRSFLAFEFHEAMIAGVLMFNTIIDKPSIAVIGLGGGALASYLFFQFPWNSPSLDAVELDPVVATVASEWFSFNHKNQENLTLNIADGLKYLDKCGKYDILVIDVDAKDLSQPILFPPPEFLRLEFLNHLRDNVLVDGLLVLNLACRSHSLLQQVLQQLTSIFKSVFCIPLQDIGDVNCVVFAFNGESQGLEAYKLIAKKFIHANEAMAQFTEMVQDCKVVDERGTII